LFVGSGITWGLVVVLVTGMLIDPLLNPLNRTALRHIYSEPYIYFPRLLTFAFPCALLALCMAAVIRWRASRGPQDDLAPALSVAHALAFAAFAYEITSGTICSMNVSSTSYPLNYDLLLLYALWDVALNLSPCVLLLTFSIALLPRKILRTYVRSASILLHACILFLAVSCLDALLMLHLTPHLRYYFD